MLLPPAGRTCKLSVLLATRRRPASLAETLRGLAAMDTNSLAWELIVIDNAGDDTTRRVVEDAAERLPLRYLVEPIAGKNRALNRALESASGALVVFTDDDVTVDANWLQELAAGAARWPEASIFGGRILPRWPDGHHALPPHPFFDHAFGVADFAREEGPYSSGYVYGGNMAIRMAVFAGGWRFDETRGPDGTDQYVPGSETSLTVMLEQEGHVAVYLPRAVVHHRIRPEQLTPAWLHGRAFRRGRAHAITHRVSDGSGRVPPALFVRAGREYLAWWRCRLRGDRAGALNRGLAYWMTRGMIQQYRRGQ